MFPLLAYLLSGVRVNGVQLQTEVFRSLTGSHHNDGYRIDHFWYHTCVIANGLLECTLLLELTLFMRIYLTYF